MSGGQPGYQIRRRGWERAFVLREEYLDCLTPAQAIRVTITSMKDPARLGWPEVGEAICLWSRVVEKRT